MKDEIPECVARHHEQGDGVKKTDEKADETRDTKQGLIYPGIDEG